MLAQVSESSSPLQAEANIGKPDLTCNLCGDREAFACTSSLKEHSRMHANALAHDYSSTSSWTPADL